MGTVPREQASSALIFDFDGVVADSETLANAVLAEFVSALGPPTTLDDALSRYCGRRSVDVMAAIETDVGKPLPPDFAERLKLATLDRFRDDLQEVRGASAFIRKFGGVPRCIASSSSADRLALCLSLLGLEAEFAGTVFSADQVARGKPYPDIFLLAARRLGVDPRACLVIEDSAGGIRAATAAGMTAIGLCAASHIRDGHAARLQEAGAVHMASSWAEVEVIAARLLGPMHSC
ncbi:HAD family hydrolase [Chelatococcus reniformis]|uniref:Haloacid dehalogenase n=1 Tax=Chelatococcus reniformis TaxID=1494448 RepID=A0A916UCK4_9HYPH|nr:HAD family phosphatase [Chelatococcus reniformis]GGC67413.1 haloacid dehalogenase [Chelatococcus reniformis]